MDTASRQFHVWGAVAGVALILALLVQAWGNRPNVDASQDQRAELFGKVVLSIAPEHAIVFAKGDDAIFALWYFQYALRNRPDLVIVATDLFQYNWYLQTLQTTSPDLNDSPVFGGVVSGFRGCMSGYAAHTPPKSGFHPTQNGRTI